HVRGLRVLPVPARLAVLGLGKRRNGLLDGLFDKRGHVFDRDGLTVLPILAAFAFFGLAGLQLFDAALEGCKGLANRRGDSLAERHGVKLVTHAGPLAWR